MLGGRYVSIVFVKNKMQYFVGTDLSGNFSASYSIYRIVYISGP